MHTAPTTWATMDDPTAYKNKYWKVKTQAEIYTGFTPSFFNPKNNLP